MIYKGIYVAVEGPNGSGKSTATQVISELLARRGTQVQRVRELGGTPYAEAVRKALVNTTDKIPPIADLLGAWSCRMALQPVLSDHLSNGDVVSDRCWISTHVFQYQIASFMCGVDRVTQSHLRDLHYTALRALIALPSIYVLLTLDADTAKVRTNTRASEVDRMETWSDVPVGLTEFDLYNDTDAMVKEIKHVHRMLGVSEPQIIILDASAHPVEIKSKLEEYFYEAP